MGRREERGEMEEMGAKSRANSSEMGPISSM